MNDPERSIYPPSAELARKWFSGLVEDLERRAPEFATDMDVLDTELLHLFHEQIDLSVQEIEEGIRERNEQKVRGAAHNIQGMGGVVGAPEISVLGEEFSAAAIHQQWARCGDLLNALQGWRTEWVPPQSEESSHVDSMPAVEGRILVVDDELPNRRYLHKILTDCGAEVILAENGEQALEKIAQHQPDVALVDVMMPGISGYEVCEQVTSRPELNQTSVIMVTAKSTVEDIEHAFLKGAFDYIRKPFQSRELMARVRNALLLKQNTDEIKSWNRRVSRDLEMAGTVQSQLFDPNPVFASSYDLRVSYRPSQHIGGDMFDLHRLSDGRLFVYVADVAGHGVGSALITTLIKGLISEILSALANPALFEIGNELHRRYRLCVLDPELYATMILVRFDPKTGNVETLSCGHPPPLVIDQEGREIKGLVEEKGGMPMGMMPSEFGLPYLAEDEVHVNLPESSTMYLYTDGLVEAKTKQGKECGEKGILDNIYENIRSGKALGDPEGVLDGLAQGDYNLTADDCTLMSLQRIPDSEILACGEKEITLEEMEALSIELTNRLAEQAWDEESVLMVRLLITEHCANVVTHGRCPSGSRLFYRLTLSEKGCTLVVSDPGIVWDPDYWRKEKSQSEKKFAESGRGLGMIMKICPEQEHFRRDKNNHSVYFLEKNLARRLHAELEAEGTS